MLLVAVGCIAASAAAIDRHDSDEEMSCQKSVETAQAKVRTERWESPEDLPDIGSYPDIHWQLRLPSHACSRGSAGPTDFAYQGVIGLRPADARRLADDYGFVPFASVDKDTLKHDSTPADVWPDLAPFLPTDARWLHSERYNEAPGSKKWRVAFLDVDQHTMLFLLNDH